MPHPPGLEDVELLELGSSDGNIYFQFMILVLEQAELGASRSGFRDLVSCPVLSLCDG